MRLIVAYPVKAYILANAWKRIALRSVKLATASSKFSTTQTIEQNSTWRILLSGKLYVLQTNVNFFRDRLAN